MTEKLDPALRIDDPTGEWSPLQERKVPRPRRGGGKNPERKRDVALRVDEIIRLRVMGVPWREVAVRVGYAQREAAQRALRNYYRDVPADNARELRAIENERYNELTRKLWPACMQLDFEAIDRFLRVSQARRQLNGIDLEPKFVLDQGANDGLPDESNSPRILELRSQLEALSFEEKQKLLAPLLRLGLMGPPASAR